MTEKQIERVKDKIAKYKKALAADKRYWRGQYHDGPGIRYLLPEQFIKIEDYKGGLKYLNWFEKNFPDDGGDPIFLFEWAFILFKCGNLISAEQKAHRTFFSNTYLFDMFLGREPLQDHADEDSKWDYESLIEHFSYRSNSIGFMEFAIWIEKIFSKSSF